MILAPLPQAVPDDSVWSPVLGAWLHTGINARQRALALPDGLTVALDIETPSITDSFTIKCVTAAWTESGVIQAVLLDPARHPEDAKAVRVLCQRARWLVLHKSSFDIPGLVAAGLMDPADISKVTDTLILARSAWPDTLIRKGLEALAERMLGLTDLRDSLKLAQRASGLTSNEKWFALGDIHMPAYRNGAMADTVVTLRLAEPLYDSAVSRQLDHPFSHYGCSDRAEAGRLVWKAQTANQVMLRAAARGYAIDLEYLDSYVDRVQQRREAARMTLERSGLRPGVGMDVVKHLDSIGHLPSAWPRTAKGTLKTDKETLETRLPDHPLADAHRTISDTRKILGYMEKVAARSRVTGRLHPQWEVLGASATGRMSASEPELQQFSEDARPIIVHEPGMHSVDYSSIEPAIMGWCSRDWEFITPFEAGADIYEPVQRAAGCSRKTAKVVVLASMYGQGRTKLSASLGIGMDEAQQLQRQMRAAMPEASRFMGLLKQIGEDHGLTLTAAGRVLTIPRFNGVPAGYKSVNYFAQGTCADFLYESIINAEKEGLGEAILLPMHDEIVCDSAAAADIQRIMSTPPEFMLKWTHGRVPVIRTDSEDIGRSWKKV